MLDSSDRLPRSSVARILNQHSVLDSPAEGIVHQALHSPGVARTNSPLRSKNDQHPLDVFYPGLGSRNEKECGLRFGSKNDLGEPLSSFYGIQLHFVRTRRNGLNES